MTIDERASDVARLITRRIIAEGRLFATNLGEFDAAQDAIATAIREAVAEEREAIARIVDAAAFEKAWTPYAELAERIRARATHPEPPQAANPPPQPPRPSDRE